MYSNLMVIENCQTSNGSYKELLERDKIDLGEQHRNFLKEAMKLEYTSLWDDSFALLQKYLNML